MGMYILDLQSQINRALAQAEDWQVLSPIETIPFGEEAINRLVQTTYDPNKRVVDEALWA